MAFKIASMLNVAIEDVFIYEGKNSVQTLIARVKNYFGFEFGFERFTETAINAIEFARNEVARSQGSQVELEHLLAGLLANPTSTSARLLQANGVKLGIETNEHSFESHEEPRFSQESKFVMELALQIVRLQGKKSIGTEHLLWGLVRLSETGNLTVKNLLLRYEVDIEALNKQLAEAV